MRKDSFSPLLGQYGGLLRLLRRQVPLGQQGGVEQDIGNGSPGLVGDVGDQRLDDLPLPLQISGGGGGAIEKPASLASREEGTDSSKAFSRKLPSTAADSISSSRRRVRAAAVPLVQAEAQAQKGQC